MEWTVTSTQSDEAFDDYVRELVSSTPPALPPNDQKFGHVETHWHQVRPGVAFIASNPDTGTFDDRIVAEAWVLAQLEPHGFKRAVWNLDSFEKTATWDDVQAKARRLIQSGNVQLIRNGWNKIIGQVQGDHGNYKTEISRDDPNSRSISGSTCQCDWGQFQNLPRTRIWKRFQDRPCAHILATYWQALGTPLDEDRAPGNFGQPGQMALPGMGGPMSAPSTMPMMKQNPYQQGWWDQPGESPAMPPGGPQNGLGGPTGPPQGQQAPIAPSPEQALPQFPMDPSMQPTTQQPQPASIPGGNPGPTPTNPIQYPGGTFSHTCASRRISVDQPFQNGDRVQLLNDDYGTLEGRSPEHGAGQPCPLKAGQVGEVLGTHPSTGMVNVLYMGKPWDNNGPMEPYGASAWHFPSDLKLRNDIRAPGPAIRRKY